MVLHTQNSECGGWRRIPLETNPKVERGIWFEVFQCQTRNYPTENKILHKVHSCISRGNATNYDMNMRKNGLLESNPKVERGIQFEILECQTRNYSTENNILNSINFNSYFMFWLIGLLFEDEAKWDWGTAYYGWSFSSGWTCSRTWPTEEKECCAGIHSGILETSQLLMIFSSLWFGCSLLV